jgi:hypothetical protein
MDFWFSSRERDFINFVFLVIDNRDFMTRLGCCHQQGFSLPYFVQLSGQYFMECNQIRETSLDPMRVGNISRHLETGRSHVADRSLRMGWIPCYYLQLCLQFVIADDLIRRSQKDNPNCSMRFQSVFNIDRNWDDFISTAIMVITLFSNCFINICAHDISYHVTFSVAGYCLPQSFLSHNIDCPATFRIARA